MIEIGGLEKFDRSRVIRSLIPWYNQFNQSVYCRVPSELCGSSLRTLLFYQGRGPAWHDIGSKYLKRECCGILSRNWLPSRVVCFFLSSEEIGYATHNQ